MRTIRTFRKFLEKYIFASFITFGAKIIVEIIVGKAINANIPSTKFITISSVIIDAIVKLIV